MSKQYPTNNGGRDTNPDAGRRPRGLDVFRMVLIVVTLIAAIYVARGYVRLFSQWCQSGRATVANSETTEVAGSMAPLLPTAGQWSFADLQWDLQSQEIEIREIGARFESLSSLAAPEHVDELPDAGEELFDLVELLDLQPVEQDGNQVYRIDRRNLKGLLVVRKVGEASKAIAIAGAYPLESGRWQLVELTPRRSEKANDAATEHLLPLPAGAKRSGGRFGADGQLLLELVSLESNADALTSSWKEAGWEVRASGLGGRDAFSFLCARGDEVIYVWSASPRDALDRLMLVRTTGDREADR